MDWLRERFQRAPVLMGCLSAIVILSVLGCGAGLLLTLGGVALFNKLEASMGVRDPFELSSRASEEGWVLGVQSQLEGTLAIDMRRFDEGPADCATAWRFVGPHLTGSAESVTVQMYVGEDQDAARVTCSWKGFPKASTEMPAPVDAVPAATQPPAEAAPSAAEPAQAPTPVDTSSAPPPPPGPPPPAPGSTEVAPPATP